MALLLFWKEAGPSSNQALGQLARTLKVQRSRGKSNVGHTGTLDPFAEGLLLVGTEEGTKLLHALQGLRKTYFATVDLAHRSASFDTETPAELNYTEAEATDLKSRLSLEKIEDFLRAQVGPGEQVPPQTSAVHIEGKRAYEWARLGVTKELKSRPMEIFELRLKRWNWPELDVEVTVSAGTYIRSLARDWGLSLGGKPARLKVLKRLGVGPWRVEREQLPADFPIKFLNLEDLGSLFKMQSLSSAEMKGIRNGHWRGTAEEKTILLSPEGEPQAWAEKSKIERVFLRDPLKNLE